VLAARGAGRGTGCGGARFADEELAASFDDGSELDEFEEFEEPTVLEVDDRESVA
jgi:hypothetical protein